MVCSCWGAKIKVIIKIPQISLLLDSQFFDCTQAQVCSTTSSSGYAQKQRWTGKIDRCISIFVQDERTTPSHCRYIPRWKKHTYSISTQVVCNSQCLNAIDAPGPRLIDMYCVVLWWGFKETRLCLEKDYKCALYLTSGTVCHGHALAFSRVA